MAVFSLVLSLTEAPLKLLYNRSIGISYRLLSSSMAASGSGQVSLSYHGPVALIKMQNGENRFTHTFFKEFISSLDEIESKPDIKALVTTGEGKFYSNGLDLDNFPNYTPEQIDHLFNADLHDIYKKMLTFPIPTIAAINGHCYAAGGLLALTHDYRIMREDRGWFCLPEIHIKMSFSVSLMEIAKARLPPSEYTNSIIFGKKYTAHEGQAAGIIQEVVSQDKVVDRALEMGHQLSQQDIDREVMREMKLGLNYAAVKALSEPEVLYSKL